MEKIGVIIGSGESKTLIVYGKDIVHAAPAFKGQKGRAGATQARFAMIAERIAKANRERKETLNRIEELKASA